MGSRPSVRFKEVSGLWRSKTNEIHYVFKIKLPGIPSSVKIVERVHGPHEKWNKIADDLNLKPVRNSFNFLAFRKGQLITYTQGCLQHPWYIQ